MPTLQKTLVKSRNSAKTRASLINAARWLLTRRSYDELGTRDIAKRAGVDVALVQRYFGSKKKLFEESIRDAFLLTKYLGKVNPDDLARRLSQMMVEEIAGRTHFDPTLVMLRSAASKEVHKVLARALEHELVLPLSKSIDKDGKRTRAAMVLAVLAGFDLVRRVLGNDALEGPEARILLEKILQSCLTG